MIVVDVGCHPQGPEESVYKLCDRFKPDVLFGFDPYPDLVEGVECWQDTLIVRRRAAAWTYTGRLPFVIDGITTGLASPRRSVVVEGSVDVECVDLAAFVAALPAGKEVVLKLDAEGAEYVLLPEIKRMGLDMRLALVLVEWHPENDAHGMFAVRTPLLCPVEEWS